MFATALLAAQAYSDKGQCKGANHCKGQSSGKTATSSCKGLNSCQGQGFLEMTKAECDNVGGILKSELIGVVDVFETGICSSSETPVYYFCVGCEL
jgi:hypothetical protein